MSEASFYRFTEMPPELRRAVWWFCLPRRVVEIDIPLADNHPPTTCRLQRTTLANSQLPLISAVCCEARRVVFENMICPKPGREDRDGKAYPVWVAQNSNMKLRVSRKVDIVHLHWHSSYDVDFKVMDASPLPSLLWLANKASSVSISAELLLPFNENSTRSFSCLRSLEPLTRLKTRDHYFVCLRIVGLHISACHATHSGLFGLWGEERIKLVSAYDTDTITKYRDAWKLYGLSSSLGAPEDSDVAQFLEDAVGNAAGFRHRVERWQGGVKKVWMTVRRLSLNRAERE